ncbi:nucleotide-binding protein, partial [gut metagenome]
MPSFDIEVKADAVELRNAVDQAQKEIGTRYDFRGTSASLEQKDLELALIADSDFQLKQVRDVLIGKLAKRGIDIRLLDET